MFQSNPYGPLWGALFTALLLVVCYTDVRARRIPNGLVLAILAAGFAFSISARPLGAALLSSLAGLAVGLGIWIVFWLFGMIGAGDVKFFGAAGTWLGPGATWRAALIAAIIGGVLAVAVLLRERRLRSGLERTALAFSSRSLAVLGPIADNQKGRHLPYGVALAAGVLVTAWIPRLLG
jgi:prepilin peptidase CpaA